MDPAIAIAASAERRRQQNRQAAAASRIKRRQYITELEQRIQHLTDVNQQLTTQLQHAQQSSTISLPPAPVAAQVAIAAIIPLPQPTLSSNNHEPVHSMATDASSPVSIVPLSHYPTHVDATAALLYAEWANLYAHENIHSVQQLAHKLRTGNPTFLPPSTHSQHSPLPATFIALGHNGTKLIGTATLDTSDLPSSHPYHPATPWVSSVLVSEQWRGKGVAGQLVRGVETEARRRGLSWLWLWTVKPNSVAMYAHLGWTVIEQVWMAEKAKHITIMRKDLTHHNQPQPPPHPQPISSPPPAVPAPPPPEPPSRAELVRSPSVDMEVVYERLESMIGSLRGVEDIDELTRVAALFAKGRLSVLENE